MRMKRWQAGLGLVFCLSGMSAANRPDTELENPAIWNDLSLLGFVFFLVMLCIGPGRRKHGSGKAR
jgi:hypothetical protein